MNIDRFKNFEPEVRELVLAFEKQHESGSRFFDVDQMEVIADYYLEVQDVEGLAAAVEYGQRLFPASDEIQLRRAHLMSIRGEYPEALALLSDLERKMPDNTDVSYGLGALYSMMDQPEKAIAYYQRASSDGYELDMIYGNIADEYYKQGKTEESVAYYKRALEKNPEEERSLYNLACTWDEQGRNDESMEFFLHFVEDHPYSKGAWYSLGCAYNWLGLYEKGADAFEYAIAIDPTLYNAYLGLAESCRSLGDTPRAVQALRDSLNYTDDRPMVLHRIGLLFFEADNYHTAMAYFHNAVKEDPAYGEAWSDLGRCCQRLGYNDEAAGYYRRAIDLDPDSDAHWLRLADLYLLSDKYSEAAALLESSRAEAADKFSFDSRLLFCYYKLGRRNRLFSLLRQDAREYASLYPSIFANYPELADDPEVVRFCSEEQQRLHPPQPKTRP